MVDNVKFFERKKASERNQVQVGSTPYLTREDKMKMYRVMIYKVHQKGTNLCVYGEKGDRFFIILEGKVGIRVPLTMEKEMDSTWDVFNYVLKQNEHIRAYKDDATRQCNDVIECIGAEFLTELQLIRVTQLVEFLKALESDNPAIFEKHQ